MLRFVLTRLLRVIPVLLLVTLAVTASLDLIPGNPAESTLGRDSTPETLHALEKQLGLNDALPLRYVKWLGRAVRLDLGTASGHFTTTQIVGLTFTVGFSWYEIELPVGGI